MSAEFPVTFSLHQGLALSSFMFIVVLDVLIKRVSKDELWQLVYADDLGISLGTEEDLQRRVVEWQESLEKKGIDINAKKQKAWYAHEKLE